MRERQKVPSTLPFFLQRWSCRKTEYKEGTEVNIDLLTYLRNRLEILGECHNREDKNVV